MKKKLFALVLAVLLPIGLLAGSGDVNGDGKIDAADIVELVNFLENHPSEKFKAEEADVNKDGDINEKDIMEIEKLILKSPYISEKSEYHIVNQGSRYLRLKMTPDIDWVETGGFTYEVIDCDGDWIKVQDGSITYDNNWTGKEREAKIIVKAVNNEHISDIVRVVQHPVTIANTSQYKTATISPNGGVLEIPIIGNTTLDVKVSSYDFFKGETKALPSYMHRIDDVIRDGNRIIRFEVDANNTEEARYCFDAFYIQMGDGPEERFRFIQLGKNAPSFEEQKTALRALYESANGKNWKDKTNWLSEKPVNLWHGVNNDIWGEDTIIGDYILRLQLKDNELVGTLPEEFESLMYAPDINDHLGRILSVDISNNGLYGTIPEAVKQHPKWNEWNRGWTMIQQNPYLSSGKLFDTNGFNLKSADSEVLLFVEDRKTTFYDLLKQNEYTLVFNSGIDDEFVNLYLDYCNKGLGVITEHIIYEGDTWDNHIKQAKDLQSKGFPSGIEWINKAYMNSDFCQVGEIYLLDKGGNLIQYWGKDFSIPVTWYVEQVRKVLQPLLGAPEEHELYGEFYTSKDIQDGEVITLQTATVGNGIDIVMMGDGYVDEDIASGKYEQNMRKGMEQFFADEVYAALRDRFNVYAVTVVSPNRENTYGRKWKLNYDDNICFEYAKHVEGVDMDNVTIINIVNNDDPGGMKGHASIYEGSGVAHIEEGGPTEIIIHEAGGHAFGKFADEYILGGYGGNRCPEDQLEAFSQWMDECHAQGMYLNVSATNDPTKVPWAHLLNDELYKDDVGLYQGAWMWPYDLWRASENSVMNTENYRFNAPCREAIYKRVMKLSEGEDWTYDFEKFAAFDAPIREAYKLAQDRSRVRGAEAQPKRRIESRPPIIYKGTWRDAGKCEKVEYSVKSK